MPGSTPFRLNRSGLLLALISTAFAGQVQAAAGRVEFAIGPATVVGTDGRTRPAARGTELDTGDTVQTNNGRVQVRMTDGGFISLQPNTEFGIKDYKFSGKADGSENALYSLFKGAMRTVTGLIGRTNRNRYLVATPTATVGIRGTGGLIEVQNDGSTLVQGTSGIWFLANPAGTIDIPAGVAGIAPVDPKQPPKETVQIPTAGPSPLPTLIEFVQGEERNESGENVIETESTPPPAVLVSGSGYAVAAAYKTGVTPQVDQAGNATAVFSGVNLVDVDFNEPFAGGKFTLDGQVQDSGNDGIIAWGRWTGNVLQAVNLCEGACSPTVESYNAPNEGLHYVIGLPTASMPSIGTATYTLLGATQPTYLDGGTAPGTFNGALTVDFGGLTVGMNLSVVMPDANYAIGGIAPISGSTFSGSADPFGGGSLSVSGTNCSCSCSALVNGFFAGPSAERAGLGYHIRNTASGTEDILGAAAFTQQSLR
ncbi:MAG TPA: FecR domain-containing protein [Burkholderiales bacterium]|nr:FecR domain-containing protein [Burkholderiales bacterium]